MPRNYRPWTRREIETLRQMYPTQSGTEIAAALGRSSYSVHHKANNLGLRKRADYIKKLADAHTARLQQLRDMAPHMTIRQMSEALGLSEKRIAHLCRHNNITPQPSQRHWADTAELREMVKTMTSTEIAQHFGVTKLAARYALKRRGLRAQPRKHSKRICATAQEREKLTVMAQTMTARQIAAALHKSVSAIHVRLRLLGLTAINSCKPDLLGQIDNIRADAQHLSINALAQKYRTTHARMSDFVRAHGIPPKPKAAPKPKPKATPKPKAAPRPKPKATPRPKAAGTRRPDLAPKPSALPWPKPGVERKKLPRPTPGAQITITWPEHVRVQSYGYAPHRHSSTIVTPATARGIYTGKELQHRSRT